MTSQPPSPPTYSQDLPDGIAPSGGSGELQINISPIQNTVQFQSGFLGIDNEHAALEGEVQIKGLKDGDWDSATITFQAMEKTTTKMVEILSSKVILFSRSQQSASSESGPSILPASIYPFSIPLTPDIPESVATPVSSLSHSLTVTLHPIGAQREPITRTIPVYVKRYIASGDFRTAPISTEIASPTPVYIELRRSIYSVDDHICAYITIPPPAREVVERGLRLRNVRAELVRFIKVHNGEQEPASSSSKQAEAGSSASLPSEKRPDLRLDFDPTDDSVYSMVLSHSGAACRFHATRPIRLRLLVASTSGIPPHAENPGAPGADSIATITQSTLFHRVSFGLRIIVSYNSLSNHVSSTATTIIPLTVTPPLRPQRDTEEQTADMDIETMYRKKHDRPPSRTVRAEEGPSTSAPPSFHDPGTSISLESNPNAHMQPAADEPPPFFLEPSGSTQLPPSFAESSEPGGSHHLPSFTESEADAEVQGSHIPRARDEHGGLIFDHSFIGEGEEFGFPATEQFDGLSPLDQPITMETFMDESGALLGLAVPPNALHNVVDENGVPPPPPAMDDPSDPPPAIDVEFDGEGTHDGIDGATDGSTASGEDSQRSPLSTIGGAVNPAQNPAIAGDESGPPPYLTESSPVDTRRPPPYVDILLPTTASRSRSV